MRRLLGSGFAVLLLASCASQRPDPGVRDASGGQIAIDMNTCSRVASDPERKLSKNERLAELHMALGAG